MYCEKIHFKKIIFKKVIFKSSMLCLGVSSKIFLYLILTVTWKNNWRVISRLYQETEKGYRERLMKGIKIFLNKKKNKKRRYGCEKCTNIPERNLGTVNIFRKCSKAPGESF